jgi:hypothetical protein
MVKLEEEVEQRKLQREEAAEMRRIERAKELERKRIELIKAEEDDGETTDTSQELSEEEGEPIFQLQQQQPPPRRVSRPHNQNEDVMTNAMTQMAETVTKLAELTLKKPEETGTGKFLSRQTIGKELPIFSGNPEEWTSFEAEYVRTTEACQFTQLENMSRLRKCLRGKAKEVVQAAMAASDKADEVMAMLNKQFGRPKYIVESLLSKIKANPVVKEGKADGLLTLSNNVRSFVLTLEQLKQKSHLSNPMLLTELIKKLPWSLQANWGKLLVEQAIEEPDLKDFSNWLEREAESVSMVCSPEPNSWKSSDEREKKGRATFTATNWDERQDTSSGSKCGFCHKDQHLTSECRDLKRASLEDRWEWVRKSGVCMSCLEAGHMCKSCPKPTICQEEDCGRTHHRILHGERVRGPGGKKKVKPKSKGSPESSEKGEAACYTFGIEKPETLLQIVNVRIAGPKGSTTTYALLDSASSVTMVHPDLMKDIGVCGPIRLSAFTGQTAPCAPMPRQERFLSRYQESTRMRRSSGSKGPGPAEP